MISLRQTHSSSPAQDERLASTSPHPAPR